jgi:predicted nucleotidyltransferase
MKQTAQTRRELNKLLRKLVSDYAPQRVILFGSHAYGEPSKDSDVDLLIIKETSERFIDRWTTVRSILSDPTRMWPLETLVLTPQEVSVRLAAGDQFLTEILDKGEVLYAA